MSVYQGKFTGKELDDILATTPEVLEKMPIVEKNVALLTPKEVTDEAFDEMLKQGTWVEGQVYFTAEEE